MSESTYFLDLKNSSMIRSINNRLASMDTILRIFPQTDYQMLRSSNITSYNDAEWNVQEQALETGSVINTGNDANIFITGRGTTTWTNSSIQMKYTKYSTGKFDAEFIVNFVGKEGFEADHGDYNVYDWVFFIPLHLIKNVDEDSVEITSFTSIPFCSLNWRKSGDAAGKWYSRKPSDSTAYRCITLDSGRSFPDPSNVNITNGRIYLSGSYNINLENA